MKLKWIRSHERFNFTRPSTYFALGVRGSGKSSFLEHIGAKFIEHNAVVLDLFGSRDGEGLAWLRSPHVKDKKVLLLSGDGVDVDSSFDSKNVEKVRLQDFENYDFLISASPLYLNIGQEFYSAAHLTDKLYKRISYKRLVYMICREAANLYYSRLKVDDNQVFAKSQMIYMIREARHIGLALGLDSVRFFSIDIDVRTLSDYMILKAQGLSGLTRDLKWLYSFVDPHLVRRLKAEQFLLLSRKGAIGYGIFPEVKWHKREKENILHELGITVTYGEPLKESILKGTFRTVGDQEHAEIIRLYVEEELSMNRISEKLKRSPRTPMVHIQAHNQSVNRSGFCSACKRVGSKYYSVLAKRKTI